MVLFFVFISTVTSMTQQLYSSIIAPSGRSDIESFKVMDLLAKATELELEGRDICHMEVGQPSSKAPLKVIEAAKEALENDKIGYTNAVGQNALRESIAKHYMDKYNVKISKDRVIICTGSSASFLMSFLACFEAGDAVGLMSSGYPCYRNIMKATGLECVTLPVNSQYKVTASSLQQEIDRRKALGVKALKGLILSSPSNPTGVMLSPKELEELCQLCTQEDIMFLSDEIYHGITYGTQQESTAVAFSDNAIVINSFSKYYSMTGWRLGWMIVPDNFVDVFNRLSQNIYINAPTLSQIAASRAFDADVTKELELNVARYAASRDVVLQCLEELGLSDKAAPSDGAFYIYVDLKDCGVTDTPSMCYRLLEEVGVAITPGVDFEDPSTGLGKQRVRFSYSRSTEEVTEGMKRFKEWMLSNVLNDK